MKKNVLKRVLAGVLAVCIAGMEGISAQAAKVNSGNAIGYFLDGEMESASGAFAVSDTDGSKYIVAAAIDSEPDTGIFVTFDGGICDLEGAGVGNYYSLWSIAGTFAEGEFEFYECAYAHQDEEVMVSYLYPSSYEEVSMAVEEMVLKDLDSEGFFTVDKYPAKDVIYPAPILNSDMELVGILIGNKKAVTLLDSRKNFSSSGTQREDKEDDTQGKDKEDDTQGKDKEDDTQGKDKEDDTQGKDKEDDTQGKDKEDDTQGKDKEDDKISPFFKDEKIMGAITIIVGIAIVIIVIIVIMRKKKKENQTPKIPAGAYPSNHTPPFASPAEDTGRTESFDGMTTEPYAAPYDAPERNVPKNRQFWLVARGGCMGGRVYPMEVSEITIGREVSSSICYPANTAGVSRVHAKLYWQNGQLMLMDCNSTSGTFLQRIGKLTPMNPVAVQSGDIFYIGEKANSFEIKN